MTSTAAQSAPVSPLTGLPHWETIPDDIPAATAEIKAAIRARIEASGRTVAQVVDLGAAAGDRLPQSRIYDVLGVGLPLVTGPYRPHLHAALRQLLLGGRVA